jgi:phosphoglycolate phosphatase-like HAD superfamily hydrolase
MSMDLLKEAVATLWDFDGVIKDSVKVKSDAFERLFLEFGKELSKKVRSHHESNGGMSRYEKFPLYLSWAGVETSQAVIEKYDEKFSNMVKQKVIESEWVDGVLEYLYNNHQKQLFFIVTATPQKEIESILLSLKIKPLFEKIIGSPVKKKDAIKMILKEYKISPKKAIMIGDSSSDYEASSFNNVPFVLRKTALNKGIQKQIKCHMIEDFF